MTTVYIVYVRLRGSVMGSRAQKAVALAGIASIDRRNGIWRVPSQSTPNKSYAVRLGRKVSCSCLDHRDGGFVCKHIQALRIALKRELGMEDGVADVQPAPATKQTYRQDWASYNRAQGTEKHRLQVLLADLCSGIPEPERKPGRRPHSFADSVFAMVFKVYAGFSCRRFSCDLDDAFANGHLSNPIPGMKTSAMMENAAFTPILTELVRLSAAPLAVVETQFAVDSTGFSANKFERWYDEKYGETRKKSVWVKAHCAVGVKTNCITAVRLLEKDSGDAPQFPDLVRDTAKTFRIEEVSADKAYASRANYEAVEAVGGTGFIAFKKNTTGAKGGLFEKMFHFFKYRQDEFLAHYHKRSNIESCFSAVKRKFGDSVRSKTETAMKNEVLCKFIAHNLTCLIQEETALGLDPVFWAKSETVPMVG